MPKIVDFEKRKDEIMQEAIKVFASKGYYETNLLDISRRCGMGRTTFYQYFKNKDEVFDHAIEHIYETLKNDYKSVMDDISLTSTEKIKLFISKLASESEKQKDILVMFIDLWLKLKRGNEGIAEKLNERMQDLRQVFSQLLEEGIKVGEIRVLNVDSMAQTLYAIVESCVLQINFAGDITLEENLESINILVDGLKA